jgi:hypothetical protein
MADSILPGIDHVVVVMFENRSFDTLLGWLYDGSSPNHFIPTPPPPEPTPPYQGLTQAIVAAHTLPLTLNSRSAEYKLAQGATTNMVNSISYLNSPPLDPAEEMAYVTDQVYGPLAWPPLISPPVGAKPLMRGFLQDYVNYNQITDLSAALKIMETYTPDQVPVMSWLAKNYACSDMWFASVPTQTNPNRAFMACGTSMGMINDSTDGVDYFKTDTIWNRIPNPYTFALFFEEYFPPAGDDSSQCWTRQCFPNAPWDDKTNVFNMAEFHRRARSGTLPSFSFIEPSWTLISSTLQQGVQGADYHPPGDVRPGEDLLGQIYSSLVSNTDAFARTLLIITFDEHGGTFDHKSPPPAKKPDSYNQYGFDFTRYGVRVPTIFVSPKILSGTVIRAPLDSEYPFDHTSIPAALLKWMNVKPVDWKLGDRVQIAPTFEAVLNSKTRPPEELLGSCTVSAAAPVSLGSSVLLQYVDPRGGKFNGWWVGPAPYSTGFGYYPVMVPTEQQALALMFTLAASVTGGTQLIDPSFVYMQYAKSPAPAQPYWTMAGEAWHTRSNYVYLDKDGAANTPNPGMYWNVKHTDPARLFTPVSDGDTVFIENRIYDDPKFWLPGKLIPYNNSDTNLTLAGDAAYNDPNQGIWRVKLLTP